MQTSSTESKPTIRGPTKCPIARCPALISEADLVDHLLTEHKDIDLKSVESDEKASISFREFIFPYGQPVCMGLLMYANHSKPSRQETKLAHWNSIKSARYAAYRNHLPVLIMGCKTHRTDMLAEEDIPSEMYNEICHRRDAVQHGGSDSGEDIFVLWLIGPSTVGPIFGQIIISDGYRIVLRGCRMQIRDFRDFLQPKRFLCEGEDYLMVHRGVMDQMTSNGEAAVQMEVCVVEEGSEI